MTTNQTIDGVRRDTVEITRELAEQLTEGWNGVNARIELRKMLDADKVNNRQMGLMQFVEEHPIKPAAQPHGEPVAEIASKYGDPEAFGERELITLKDISKFPYGTKLYAEQSAPVEGDPIGSFDRHMEYMAENIRLKAENETLRKKAERYNWIANQAETESYGGCEWALP